jgi:AAHS family 4-hydroxybenzoate transporter-like MFS transporter
LLWTGFFMSLIDIYLLSSWLPTVFHDAGITLSLSVIATAVFQGGGVVASLVLGNFVDRFGVYRVLSITFFLGAVSVAILGYSHSVVSIMACTFFAGAGVIGGQTGANALAASFYPTYIRSTGVGWALGIGRIGSIVGPILGGIMLSMHLPLSTIFLVAAIPSLVGSAAIFLMGRTQAPVKANGALSVAAS